MSTRSSIPSPASASSFEESPAGLEPAGFDPTGCSPLGLGGSRKMPSSLSDLDGLGPGFAIQMKKVGIRTTEKLLETAKSLKGRQMLAEKTDITQDQLLRIANMIDRMRIKGVGQDYAALLEAAGVSTIKELRNRNPARLAEAMAKANSERKLVRVLPSEQTVGRWIHHAKNLPVKISY
jgi:predicted flap endonuclease-1-like 5' DNA nuclease